jgi:hypothetical protein
MARYVLMFTGSGKKPKEDMARIKATPGVTIIDSRDAHVVIVEGSSAVKRAVNKMDNWIASEQTFFAVPEPRPNF